MLEKLDQVIKQASRVKSSDQAPILTIKILDHCWRWKYRAHSGDYLLYMYMYRRLAKVGPWAVHFTLGSDWGVGGHSCSIIVVL